MALTVLMQPTVVFGGMPAELVAVPTVYASLWMDALRPVGMKLLPQLSAVFRDARRRETERSLATDIIADGASTDHGELCAIPRKCPSALVFRE